MGYAYTVSRDDHLVWCKTRALAYLGVGDSDVALQFRGAADPVQAISSFLSDMGKHPATRDHPVLAGMLLAARLTPHDLATFIEGFN